MAEPPPKVRFQMLRSYTLADAFTLANAACGTVTIFVCLEYLASGKQKVVIWPVFGLLLLAVICDVLDGFIARKGRRPSILGADLDSLADLISFGVAPAVLGYTLGLRGMWDIAILVYFVVCGLSRLARFNVTAENLADESGKVTHYEGTPIPTSLVLVAILGILVALDRTGASFWLGSINTPLGTLHFFSLLYALNGSAMISGSLRIPKP